MGTPPKTPDYWKNTHPDCVLCTSCGWVEISSGEKIRLDARYPYIEILVKTLLGWSTDEEVLKKEDDYAKRYWDGLQ